MGNYATSYTMPRVCQLNVSKHLLFSVSTSHLLSNLAGSHQQEVSDQRDISLSLIQETALELGPTYIPDINTTEALKSAPTQLQVSAFSSQMLGQNVELGFPRFLVSSSST